MTAAVKVLCRADTAMPDRPCCLPANHKGAHLPYRTPWPRRAAE